LADDQRQGGGGGGGGAPPQVAGAGARVGERFADAVGVVFKARSRALPLLTACQA
jgi:hypothetical protein